MESEKSYEEYTRDYLSKFNGQKEHDIDQDKTAYKDSDKVQSERWEDRRRK